MPPWNSSLPPAANAVVVYVDPSRWRCATKGRARHHAGQQSRCRCKSCAGAILDALSAWQYAPHVPAAIALLHLLAPLQIALTSLRLNNSPSAPLPWRRFCPLSKTPRQPSSCVWRPIRSRKCRVAGTQNCECKARTSSKELQMSDPMRHNIWGIHFPRQSLLDKCN